MTANVNEFPEKSKGNSKSKPKDGDFLKKSILLRKLRQDKNVPDFAFRLYSEVASLANKNGYCFATNEYLGEIFGKSIEHVSRTISTLQKHGYLNLIIESGFKRRIYLNFDLCNQSDDENIKGGKQKHQGGLMEMSRGIDGNVNQELIKKEYTNLNNLIRYNNEDESSSTHSTDSEIQNESEKPKEKSGGKKEKVNEEQMYLVYQVVEYLNEKNKFQNLSFRANGKQTQAVIFARAKLDKWTLEDFKTVIDFKVHEWGKTDKMRHLLCPSTLFRACHAETYLTTAKAWKDKPSVEKPKFQLYREEGYRELPNWRDTLAPEKHLF